MAAAADPPARRSIQRKHSVTKKCLFIAYLEKASVTAKKDGYYAKQSS